MWADITARRDGRTALISHLTAVRFGLVTLSQQIELVDIATIQPHPDNPRQGDIGAIAMSIAVNGWWSAVLCSRRADGSVIILAGEHRWRALTALQQDGWTSPEGTTTPYDQLNGVPPAGQVPVIILDGLTLAQERKVLLADNRANDVATYDNASLAELLAQFANDDDLLGTLFDATDVDDLLNLLAAPPRLHGVIDEEPDVSAFWPTIKFTVAPDVYQRWSAHLVAYEQNERVAFVALLDAADG